VTNNFHDLITRMANELDEYRRLLLDDCTVTHRLSNEARTALAEPGPERPTDEERFEHWWYHEGSAPPRAEDDSEEHTHRTSKIAWLNGAYCARYGNRTPAPIPLSERQP